MKYLLITLSLLLAGPAFGFDVPKDAIIKVYTKDGKEIGKMTRKKFKVVKIEEKKKVIVKAKKEVEKDDSSIILHAGIGRKGLETGREGNYHTVSEKDTAVFGLTYCYTPGSLGFCASGFSNSSGFLGLKKDF